MNGLPTPRTTLRARYVTLLVWCKGGCQHQAHADLQALIDQGKGDVPLSRLKFRCPNCGSDRTDFVVTSRERAARPPQTHRLAAKATLHPYRGSLDMPVARLSRASDLPSLLFDVSEVSAVAQPREHAEHIWRETLVRRSRRSTIRTTSSA